MRQLQYHSANDSNFCVYCTNTDYTLSTWKDLHVKDKDRHNYDGARAHPGI